jgi:integrase/recombinase XerD
MQEEIGLYLNYLALELNLAENSREAYRHDVERFSEYSKSRGIKQWSEVTGSHAISYLAELGKMGLAPSSMARNISALRGFFKFLFRERIIARNPASRIQVPRLYRNLPEVLTVSEMEQILDSIDPESRYGLRDRAALELLYGSGLRISELISLESSNLFLEIEQLRVFGKGGKERVVPVSQEAKHYINRYLEEERPMLASPKSRDVLILSRFGTQMSRMGMFLVVRKRVQAAGITKSVSPHTFRHSFASHLVDGGASLRAVQEMLGHADITTTTIYTQLSQSYLRSVHREFHPRERKHA